MSLRASAAPILVLLAGCAGAGTVAPPAPLGYGVPTPATVEYVVGDSARVQIEAAGQSFAVNAEVGERWRMEFAAAPGGVRVTATLTDLDARMTSPLSRPQTADESAVSGPVVFVLDPRGHATVEGLPDVTAAVAQFVSGSGIAHSFFPRLPGRAIAAGARWVDTVAYTADESGARTEVRTITTYEAVGDSVVEGTPFLLVRADGTTEQSSAGTIAGTEFRQQVAGTTAGHFLWDRTGGMLRSIELRGELRGKMEVTISPVPLDVTVRSTVRARREPE